MNQFIGVLLEENEHMSLWLLRLQLSDHLTRVACSQRVGGDVLVYHTSGTDHAVVSDGYTGQQLSLLHTRWRKLVVAETRLFACCPLCNQLQIIVCIIQLSLLALFFFGQFHVNFMSVLRHSLNRITSFNQILNNFLSCPKSEANIVKWLLK